MPKREIPKLIFAASDSCADLWYATGFSVADPFLFLRRDGKTTILLSDLEIDRGRRQAKVDEVASLSEIERPLEKKLQRKPEPVESIARFLRQRRIGRAEVPSDFPFGLADALGRVGVRLLPAPGPFWPEREFKNPEEIKHLQEAIHIAELGMARGIEVLRNADPKRGRLIWAGQTLTSEILRAEIETAMLRAGGFTQGTIVAGGDQACDPHERGFGPLRAHSLIVLDIFPRDTRTGYYGDITRTVLRGRASEAQRRLWQTVLDGQELALRSIRPGVAGKDLQEEVSKMFKEKGFPTEQREGRWVGFFHGLGHGLGLDIHETPRIAQTVFQVNQVVTVEPGLYVPGVGGVRHEEDGIVTADGFRVLTGYPKVLEL